MPSAKSRQIIIVGAGLFGSMAAKVATANGWKCTVIDSRKEESGSKPAACLMSKGWLSGLPGSTVELGLDTLSKHYGTKVIDFKVNGVKYLECLWVNPKKVLLTHYKKEAALDVGDGYVITERETYEGIVLVAAGVWCNELLGYEKMPEVKSLMGSALIFEGKTSPRIDVWAPYKQAVQFNMHGKVWFGDGTSILRKNWNGSERVGQSLERASKYGIKKHPSKILVGQRPYIQGEKGFLEKLSPRLWVSTGGAKNGTMLAAYQAAKFVEGIS